MSIPTSQREILQSNHSYGKLLSHNNGQEGSKMNKWQKGVYSSNNVAKRQAGESHVYCEAKQGTVPRLCWPLYIVAFRTILKQDPCSAQLSITETIWLCAEHFCLRPFGPPYGCVGPIFRSDDLNCRSQLKESCCLLEFWLCCARSLLSRFSSVGERFWRSLCYFFGRLLLNGSCGGVDYLLHLLWPYSPVVS